MPSESKLLSKHIFITIMEQKKAKTRFRSRNSMIWDLKAEKSSLTKATSGRTKPRLTDTSFFYLIMWSPNLSLHCSRPGARVRKWQQSKQLKTASFLHLFETAKKQKQNKNKQKNCVFLCAKRPPLSLLNLLFVWWIRKWDQRSFSCTVAKQDLALWKTTCVQTFSYKMNGNMNMNGRRDVSFLIPMHCMFITVCVISPLQLAGHASISSILPFNSVSLALLFTQLLYRFFF